jgi:phospholipid N-methyltransferase
MCCRR